MPTTSFARLRHILRDLHERAALVALKTGTEVEDMAFEEVRLLRAISDDIVPVYAKIGGAEARNDIRELASAGVDGLIAPMIESTYALEKFIESLHSVLGSVIYDRMVKGINLETITAFHAMEQILSAPEAAELDQLTAARSDLSGSMKCHADDPEVLSLCAIIVNRARDAGLRTSVGGGIHPEISDRIIQGICPDTINTRHMVLAVDRLCEAPAVFVEQNLRFELELYRYLASMPSSRQQDHARRAEIIAGRLAGAKTGAALPG